MSIALTIAAATLTNTELVPQMRRSAELTQMFILNSIFLCP